MRVVAFWTVVLLLLLGSNGGGARSFGVTSTAAEYCPDPPDCGWP